MTPLRACGLLLDAIASGVVALDGSRSGEDLHRRLQEARLAAELSCGRPTILASEPPDADSLERYDWLGLLETAANGAPHERWQAIEILGELGDARAVPALLRALADRRGASRPCLAAQSLGRLRDPRAVDALIDAAGQRRNEDLRLCAIKSLGLLRAERAVPVLADAVHRGEMLVAAAYSLARIGTLEGAQVVAEAARNAEHAVWLVGPLGEFGLEAVEPVLQRLMGTAASGGGTRRAAREALWKLEVLSKGDREASLAQVLGYDPAPERRACAAWRLGDDDLRGGSEQSRSGPGPRRDGAGIRVARSHRGAGRARRPRAPVAPVEAPARIRASHLLRRRWREAS